MKSFACASTVLACGAIVAIPSSASASIVKAPVGETGQLALLSSVKSGLERQHVGVSRTGATAKKGQGFALPYTLSRWDFDAHEGDVAFFSKGTGIRFRLAGGRSIAMVHPRVVIDGRQGYITALISNVRVKTFTFPMTGKVTDTPSLQSVSGLRLKLTKASADFLNKGLRRKVLRPFTPFATLTLRIRKPVAAPGTTPQGGGAPTAGGPTPAGRAPGQSGNPGATVSVGRGLMSSLPITSELVGLDPSVAVDTDGDGVADSGVFGLGLTSSTLDATTRTGTIRLDGGLAVRSAGQDVAVLDDPEVVLGATPATSGLFAVVNGTRIKVGGIDPGTLDLDVANDTVTIKGLDVRVSAAGAPLLNQLLGTSILPGDQLLNADLAVPQL